MECKAGRVGVWSVRTEECVCVCVWSVRLGSGCETRGWMCGV